MLVDHDRRRHGAPDHETGLGPDADRRRPSAMHRFLGGSPAGVLLRLLFLSVLAGAFMSMLGLTPGRLFWHAYESTRTLIALGLESVHDFGGWILAGAVVVVPLWLVSRLLAVSR